MTSRLIMTCRKNRNRRFQFVFFTAVAAFVIVTWCFDTKSLPSGPVGVSTIVVKDNSKLVNERDNNNKKRKHDFYYDREIWDRNSPRIALLAGPHKTASTTIQEFFVELTGLTVVVDENTTLLVDENTTQEFLTPKYSDTEWVWPIGVEEEFGTLFRKLRNARKFYAAFTSFISGRRTGFFLKQSGNQTQNEREAIANYFRSLFRRPWEDGKKIMIAAESFDSLVIDLQEDFTRASNRGEETHVAPSSSAMIDDILDLLPFENPNTTKALNVNGNPQNVTPLRLEDIEIQINYRTPRIDHVVSIWHQLGRKHSLREFIVKLGTNRRQKSFYQLNSLALALQFVRKGIKTTIIDMKGVFENQALNSTSVATENGIERTANNTTRVVGGLLGVVACDILKMGDTPDLFCDKSILYLPNFDEPVEPQNTKRDKSFRNLTDVQMDEINRAFEEYDCGVWQHLKKYQEQGLFRILYPSEHLFESCNPDGNTPDISFRETLEKAGTIAYRG
eukprot:CAMPEP_0116105024 /NCGR_PEP_ID=MMETSP0327-20121206/14789_1 /TAXON_ID=44447 /ORGANISM="Pseudo-nitzschia delicatissima, Strain B596" /LENGTH=504 /DNA_ID=CAMNT_0003597357 /DNA_START=146 /DNA_END=1660 /DNA_ORIENTATION=-